MLLLQFYLLFFSHLYETRWSTSPLSSKVVDRLLFKEEKYVEIHFHECRPYFNLKLSLCSHIGPITNSGIHLIDIVQTSR